MNKIMSPKEFLQAKSNGEKSVTVNVYKFAQDYAAYAISAQEKSGSTDKLDDINFWKRLEMFVENVRVSDPMSEEEKEMILHIAKEKQKA